MLVELEPKNKRRLSKIDIFQIQSCSNDPFIFSKPPSLLSPVQWSLNLQLVPLNFNLEMRFSLFLVTDLLR